MVGDTDGTIDLLYNDLQNGDIVVTFEGDSLEASPILLVDGEEYTVEVKEGNITVVSLCVCVCVCKMEVFDALSSGDTFALLTQNHRPKLTKIKSLKFY